MKLPISVKLLAFECVALLAILAGVDSVVRGGGAGARAAALIVAGGGFAVCFAAAWISASRQQERLRRLRTLGDTLLDPPVPHGSRPGEELDALERTLRLLGTQLSEKFETWKQESSRSEAIFSSMAEGVLAVDRELRVAFCNRALTRTFGVRPPGRRMPVLELLRDSELASLLSHVVKNGEPAKRKMKILAANDRVFEVQAATLSTAGGQGALALFYDVTDLERLEQVRKDFVANVSHEMRTPLASIVGYADTLLEGGLDDPEHNQRFVEIIRTNAIRLNSIASDLLVLSELESGIHPGDPEPILVREVLESAITTVESEARTRNVHIFRGEIHDARVLGYKFQLEQALLNLLVNAVKFNRDGGEVRVEVRCRQDQQVQISVSDRGVGIPSQDLPRIFERFYRVDKARSRQVGGTGLGLSIVRHVVDRMNGKMNVESQLGKGSTFTILLPPC